MPQPKSSPGRSAKGARTTGPRRDEESVARGLTSLRELLARAVMLPTERLREAMDDAVRRGRMTRADAEDLTRALITLGRRQTEDLLTDLERLLGRQRVTKEVERSDDAFPITGYDDLAAAEIIPRLDDLEPAALRRVRDYERRHGNRKTVLSAVERKLD
jgi:hypothetical protein